MATNAILGGADIGMSLLGMLQGKPQERAARQEMTASAGVLNRENSIMGTMEGLAANYNPQAETDASVGYATQVANQNEENVLKQLNQQFASSGGSPTGDTAFGVNEAAQSNRIYDPLKAFAANQRASQFQRQMQAWASALGGQPGTLADNYMRLSQMNQPNMTGVYQTLLSGLNKFLPQGNPASKTGSSNSAISTDSGGGNGSGFSSMGDYMQQLLGVGSGTLPGSNWGYVNGQPTYNDPYAMGDEG